MIDVETADRRPLFRAARIPVRFKGVTLTDMDLHGYGREITHSVRQFIRDVCDGHVIGKRGNGLLLMGDSGHGKTMLACAIANEVLARSPLDALRTNESYLPHRPVYFSSWSNLLRLKQDQMHLDSRSDAWDDTVLTLDGAWGIARDPASVVRLLVLDDVGREHTTSSGWSEHTLGDLLRTRFDLALPTVITSNLIFDGDGEFDWEKAYGTGTASLLVEACTVLPIHNDQGSLRRSPVTANTS